MSEPRILAINLGATSSKFALYEGERCLSESNMQLDSALVRATSAEQRAARLAHLKEFLSKAHCELSELQAIAARGGLMKPLSSRGVYRVDKQMVEDLASERYGSHPANLSAPIAYELVAEAGIELPVYVVDPIVIDTLWDEARVSGLPEVRRQGRYHALNVHCAARRAASQLGLEPHLARLVVGHFGSGVSVCSLVGGRCVDVNDAQLGEGPFSVSRAGTLPIRGVLDLAYAEPDRKKLEQRLSRAAGLAAFTGTADFVEVERMLDAGNPAAHTAYRAMVFQSAKYIAAAAGAMGEAPDAIVLTGGMLKSERFANDLTERIEWLAPVVLLPGEDEMPALAAGVLAVLRGSETPHSYAEIEDPLTAPPRDFDEVVKRATACSPCRFVVVGGDLPDIAETVRMSRESGIGSFTLLGPKAAIEKLLKAEGLAPGEIDVRESADVVADAIAIVRKDPHSALVKGNCNTAALLKAVLNCLPDEGRPFLSHVAVIENLFGGRLVGISDGGLNLDPDREKKIGMMVNAIAMFRALGVRRPHVLLSAGMEDKGQDIPAIADARELVKRHRAGEWAEAVIDGPFGMDIALSGDAAAIKGIKSPVAGRADIVITPNLESCNFAVKMAHYYSGRPWGGLVVGGPFPVVLGSRSDDAESRLCSVALAQLVAAGMARIAAPHSGSAVS